MASLFRIPPPMDETTRVRCDAMMKQVENACSDMLLAPDWTLNMQIVDDLNRERDPVVLIEVIRILRKRLGSTNTRVLSVGLTLAETLVKNCHDPVHKEMASERFMTAVAKIARTYSFKTNRESIAIADQALDIVQAWGEAFLPRRREFPLFVETYHELRAEGLPFSEQYQSDRPPVLDPGAGSLLDRPSAAGSGQGSARPATAARSAAAGQVPQVGGGQGAGGAAKAAEGSDPNDLRELSVSDREIVATGASCSEMLEQVLQAAESRAEVRDSEITAEVVEQLKQVGPKISGIIEANGEGDAGMLEALFKVNDAVDSVLRLYKDVVDGVKAVPLLPPSSYSSNIGAVSARMDGLSIEQVAGARAAASKLRKNIPTLSRPPSDRKHRRGKSSESTDKAKAGGSADTVDLLSGFELDGASNSNANKSVAVTPGQGDAAASASAAAPGGADIFAGFAAPAPPPAATSAASAATAAGAGGDWVVVGGAPGGEVQAQENPAAAVAAGEYARLDSQPSTDPRELRRPSFDRRQGPEPHGQPRSVVRRRCNVDNTGDVISSNRREHKHRRGRSRGCWVGRRGSAVQRAADDERIPRRRRRYSGPEHGMGRRRPWGQRSGLGRQRRREQQQCDAGLRTIARVRPVRRSAAPAAPAVVAATAPAGTTIALSAGSTSTLSAGAAAAVSAATVSTAARVRAAAGAAAGAVPAAAVPKFSAAAVPEPPAGTAAGAPSTAAVPIGLPVLAERSVLDSGQLELCPRRGSGLWRIGSLTFVFSGV